MAEYIEREALTERLHQIARSFLTDGTIQNAVSAGAVIGCIEVIDEFPAADVAEVKHGEWIDKPTGAYGRWQSWCSACGKHSGIGGITSNQHKPFCPNCGADMRG